MSIDRPEGREQMPEGREIKVYLYRHGEAAGQGSDMVLTENGKEQARRAAEELLATVEAAGGGVIKFLASPVTRAQETMAEMEHIVREHLEEAKLSKIKLFNSRKREGLKTAGVFGALQKQGIADPVEHWLKNPDVVKDSTPEQVAAKMTEVLGKLQKVADRLPPGEKIYYVCITHELPQAALLNRVSGGKTVNDLGGQIQNCEAMTVDLRGHSTENPKLHFRDQQFELGLEK